MTALKIQGKLGANAAEAIAPHAAPMFAKLGATRMAVVELRSAERTEPAEGEEKEQSGRLHHRGRRRRVRVHRGRPAPRRHRPVAAVDPSLRKD